MQRRLLRFCAAREMGSSREEGHKPLMDGQMARGDYEEEEEDGDAGPLAAEFRHVERLEQVIGARK